MTSPTEVDPNWDPGNWSLWKVLGWKNIHLEPGRTNIHLEPGQETSLHRQRQEASHLRGPS